MDEQIAYGFRLAISRYPKEEEKVILKEIYQEQESRFKDDPKEASKLLSVGKKALDNALDKTKTAALTMVANTILNHDETYMKR